MSTYQTKSGLWIQGNQPLPVSTNGPMQSVAQASQPIQADAYDSNTGAMYRWPPKLPKAIWIVVAPLLLGVLCMMAFALIFIGAVAYNIFV
jgi:hypothetical protein